MTDLNGIKRALHDKKTIKGKVVSYDKKNFQVKIGKEDLPSLSD